MKRTKRVFTDEFKADAVRLVLEEGKKIVDAKRSGKPRAFRHPRERDRLGPGRYGGLNPAAIARRQTRNAAFILGRVPFLQFDGYCREMRAAVLVGVIACGPGLGAIDTHTVGRTALVDASGNAAAIEKLLYGLVVDGGMWFNDPGCAAQFSEGRELKRDEFPAFARCLAELHLQASPREDALGDVVVMTYEPGIEIEARVIPEEAGPHLVWIGYESRRAIDASIPTITSDTLESLRIAGDRNGPLDPSTASGLELDATPKSHAAFTWIRLCLDETGAVTLAHPFETTSSKASNAFVAAAGAWTFRPFTVAGRVLPACSMVRMTYPVGQGPTVETLPMPPPPGRDNKEPIVFAEGTKLTEGKRISGTKLIAPDDHTKTAIQHSGHDLAPGLVSCILHGRETGHIDFSGAPHTLELRIRRLRSQVSSA